MGKKQNAKYCRQTSILRSQWEHQTAVYIENKVTLFLQTPFQAPITPNERHLESNQQVQWRSGSWGPPLNLLIALQMSSRGSYGSLKVGLQNQSYFILDIHGCKPKHVTKPKNLFKESGHLQSICLWKNFTNFILL
jgi:hypothetical protein